MSIFDILAQLQIPAWAVLGAVLFQYYRHRLERMEQVRVAKLTNEYEKGKLELINRYEREKLEITNRYEREKLQYEKFLELLQERHRARLEAVVSSSMFLAEFEHTIDHIRKGNSHYEGRLQVFSTKAREAARKYENLLGTDFKEAVREQTDAGLSIINAKFSVTSETIDSLKRIGVPVSVIQNLETKLDKAVPVLQPMAIVDGLGEELLMRFKYDIFRKCSVSDEYDLTGHAKATRRVEEHKKVILVTLPSLEIGQVVH